MTHFWKQFSLLLLAGLLGTVAISPLLLNIYAPFLSEANITAQQFLSAQFMQLAVLLGIATYTGLKIAPNTGYAFPAIDALIKTRRLPTGYTHVVLQSAAWGVTAALSILLVDVLFRALGTTLSADALPAPLWQRLLASFYGGITEELLLRLGVMTGTTWLLAKFVRKQKTTLPNWVYWLAIVLSSLLFGALHLPVTAALAELTPLLVLRALLLNSIGGVVFGWLFWKRGLLAAITAHFAADIVLQLLPSLL